MVVRHVHRVLIGNKFCFLFVKFKVPFQIHCLKDMDVISCMHRCIHLLFIKMFKTNTLLINSVLYFKLIAVYRI